MGGALEKRVDKLEQGTNKIFKHVFEKLDNIEELVTPKCPANRKKIGLGLNTKNEN